MRITRTGSWLHRRGIARVLNTGTNSWNDIGSAYIAARGPRLLAEALAVYALKHTTGTGLDWSTIVIGRTQHVAALSYRFTFSYRRI